MFTLITFHCIFEFSSSTPTVKCTIYEYGVYEPVGKAVYVPNTADNVRMYEDIQLVAEDSEIILLKNMVFGVRYKIVVQNYSKKNLPIYEIVKHPKFSYREGDRPKEYSILKTKKPIIDGVIDSFFVYSFDEDIELQEGLWKFSIEYNTQELCSKEFHTLKEKVNRFFKNIE